MIGVFLVLVVCGGLLEVWLFDVVLVCVCYVYDGLLVLMLVFMLNVGLNYGVYSVLLINVDECVLWDFVGLFYYFVIFEW